MEMRKVRLLVLAASWVGLLLGACSSGPEESRHITQGASLTEGQKKLVPVLECVRPIPQGFAAQFGYENTSGVAQDLVVGVNNGFGLPEPEDDQGQPTRFAAGRQRNVFQVPFTNSLTWTLGQSTATATPLSTRCGSSLPPPRETFEFHVPQGVALASVVLGQEESLILQADSRVLPGSTGFFTTAFGDVTVGSRVQLGSLVGKGAVTLGRSSVVAGDLRSEGEPELRSGAVVRGLRTIGPVLRNKVSFSLEKRLGSSGYVGVGGLEALETSALVA
ncbi:MAG: hypothetical protein SFV15_05385 [Polyangiaceae bacterium]|nr:hypothetical protein [Polyangiaceae bacterium]